MIESLPTFLRPNLQLTLASIWLPRCGACSAVVPKSFDRYRLKKQGCATVTSLGTMYESFFKNRKLVQGMPELVCRSCRESILRVYRLRNQLEAVCHVLQGKIEHTLSLQQTVELVNSDGKGGLKRSLLMQSPQSWTGLTPAAKKQLPSPVKSPHHGAPSLVPLRQKLLRPKPKELFPSVTVSPSKCAAPPPMNACLETSQQRVSVPNEGVKVLYVHRTYIWCNDVTITPFCRYCLVVTPIYSTQFQQSSKIWPRHAFQQVKSL